MSNSALPDPHLPHESEPLPLPSIPDFTPWADGGSGPLDASGPAAVVPPSDSTRRVSPTIGHVGRYALKHTLGTGGLGTVYAAHDPLLSRLIAVKTLHVEVPEAQRSDFNDLFLNEARAAGGLSHPHIVTVYDAGISSDQRAYIAMELLKGRDLRKLREEGWRASPAQAALIVRRVADALAYAHSKGVVHRDIKPANIFMVGQTQPRVLDFGIARVARERSTRLPAPVAPEAPARTSARPLRADASAHPLTLDSSHRAPDIPVAPCIGPSPGAPVLPGANGAAALELVAGSPYYMAPEQVLQQDVDRRADVFSLGVVLYEMLADVKPFTGSNLAEIHHAVLHHRPPLADTVDPAVPPALARIAARAMEKDPDRRYRSARAFAADLRRWLAEDAEPSRPAEISPAQPQRRRRGSAIAIAGLALASVVGWAVMSLEPARSGELTAVTAARPAAAIAIAVQDDGPGASPASRATTSGGAPETNHSAAPSPTPVTASDPGSKAVIAVSSTLGAVGGDSIGSEGGRPLTRAAPDQGSDLPSTPEPQESRRSPLPADRLAALAEPMTTKPAGARDSGPATMRDGPNTRKQRQDREATNRQGAVKPVPVAPAADGVVKLAISPWGQVEVDGALVGTAPPLHELKLREGRHQVVIRNADFPPFSAPVQVTPGQPVTLRHKFGS